MKQYFTYKNKFHLESGEFFNSLEIAYSIQGNHEAEKTVWVCHALTGNADVFDWWGGLFGENRFFNPQEYRIICANVIGSCYGSTGPEGWDNPRTFPTVTIRDMASAHELLSEHLGIAKIDVLIGASLGGQQALEWAIEAPRKVKNLVLIACNAVHSPLGRAYNEAQRLALLSDESFGKPNGGQKGLMAARAIAMLSYRSYEDFLSKQRDVDTRIEDFKAASYLRYQGEKFVTRFRASAYYVLSKAMDSHDVSRGRGSIDMALEEVKARTLVVGVNSDVLFPLEEQKVLAQKIVNAELGILNSPHGHDAFLIEYEQLELLVREFLFNGFKLFKPTTLKIKTTVN